MSYHHMMIRNQVTTNPFKWLYEKIYTNYSVNLNPEERKEPPMLNLVLPFVANMLRDIVVDKAQNLASEHLEKHLDKLPPEVKDALDGAVNNDNSHGHKSLSDLIKG